MEEIDSLGIFWLPGKEEEEILSGRLTFDPKVNGTRLSLVGIFSQLMGRNQTSGNELRIHGLIDNKEVTLDRCFETGSYVRQPGPYGSTFYANELFIGYHLEEHKEFDSVTVSIAYLDVLMENCGISERSIAGGYVVELAVPESDSAEFSRGTVSVGFRWQAGDSSLAEASISSEPFLRIDYRARQEFKAIQHDVSHLESLVSMCIDGPTFVDRTALRRSDMFVTMINGSQSSVPQPVEYQAPTWKYIPAIDRKRLHPLDLFLTFNQLGGIERVASWLDKSAELHRPISSLMSVKQTNHMFAENKFMNVTYAAEALHRSIDGSGHRMAQEQFEDLLSRYVEVTPDELHQWLLDRLRFANEPSLTKRLNRMAAHIGPMVKPIIGSRDRWAGTIASVRNDITHLGAQDCGLDGGTLYYLTESVLTIAQLYLLLQIGVPAETMRTKLDKIKLARQSGKVAISIEAARDYIRANS